MIGNTEIHAASYWIAREEFRRQSTTDKKLWDRDAARKFLKDRAFYHRCRIRSQMNLGDGGCVIVEVLSSDKDTIELVVSTGHVRFTRRWKTPKEDGKYDYHSEEIVVLPKSEPITLSGKERQELIYAVDSATALFDLGFNLGRDYYRPSVTSAEEESTVDACRQAAGRVKEKLEHILRRISP